MIHHLKFGSGFFLGSISNKLNCKIVSSCLIIQSAKVTSFFLTIEEKSRTDDYFVHGFKLLGTTLIKTYHKSAVDTVWV